MSPPVADSTKSEEKKVSQRRINKPLIEKRRRARINECLAQLKVIVLEATEKQLPRPSKLEKADILEMTVDYIKNRHTTSPAAVETPTEVESTSNGYHAGYKQCLGEIANFLEQTRSVDESTRRDIIDHVTGKIETRDSRSSPVVTETKPPTIPLAKHKEEMLQQIICDIDNLPMDLRVNKPIHSDCQLSGINNTTDSTSSNLKINPANQQTGSNHVTANLPMGLVSGGQVFLLVQLPTSQACITSQQTPEVSSAQEHITPPDNLPIMVAANGLTTLQTAGIQTPPIVSSSSGKIDNLSNSCLLPLNLTRSRDTKMADKMVLTATPYWQLVSNPHSVNLGDQDSHWRPWSPGRLLLPK